MKEIVEAIQSLSKIYEVLSANTNLIFNTLKTKDYKTKEMLEKEIQELYKLKEVAESYLIKLVKEKADQLHLEDKRIEAILNGYPDNEEKMLVHYELEQMINKIQQFQFYLKRNIEFAKSFIDVKGKEIEFMFEAIQREQYQMNGPMLINQDL
ncbi:hypothetical protein [Priestia aryabhattai]